MKIIKYILSLFAACVLMAYAADKTKDEKVLPKHPASPPAAQHSQLPASVLLSGSADGIPYGLHVADVNNKAVTLQWNNPEPTNGYFDDFEGHPDFVINSPGSIGWDYLDMDNANTYTWAAASFPNQGQKMSFIVMNPSKTSPSTGDYITYKPYSGKKMLVDFCSTVQNNDYIFSPELSFGQDFQISFRAKSYTAQYGLERVRVGYSTTGKNPSNFTIVSQEPYVEVPDEWTLMKYSIPKEAKYVMINCVSNDAFMLLIDDIFVGTNIIRPKAPGVRLYGYNLYRDCVKVNPELITEMSYVDTVQAYSSYDYTVSAVYSDGSESPRSQIARADVPDIRLLPFEDDFSSWTINTEKWSMTDDNGGDNTKWNVDYYPYGLADPSAAYAYSILKNYSQSLVTREMNTQDPDNTYLRFELRLINYNGLPGDSLSVEVSTDDTSWQTVHTYYNSEGTYPWRVEQFCLKDVLAGQHIFKVRFRAFGEDAYYLDYWFVDDVKVWNPQWTTAQLTISHDGSPMSGCKVSLVADQGAKIDTISANGTIRFDKIEAGIYEVSVNENGCNPYTQTWNIAKNSENVLNADIVSPSLQIDSAGIVTSMTTENTISKAIKLRNVGSGSLTWNLRSNYADNSGDNTNCWDVQRSFNASGDLQSSVAFDGENYYASSSYFLGTFYKYDKDGGFLGQFSVPGMYYKLYDLAFDGTYFYGSDKTNTLFQLDLRNKRLIKEIKIASQPDLEITHCCYDTRNDQFWVGGYSTVGRVDRDGNVKVAFRPISSSTTVSTFGSAFDNVTPGGPYIWFGNQVTEGNNSIDCTQIIQYSLNTRRIVSTHATTDIPGYKVGDTNIGPNYIDGLEVSTCVEDGTVSLIGILQQSPSRIFSYKLCDADKWLGYSPKQGVIEAGGEQLLTINYNTRNASLGESRLTELQLFSLPEIGSKSLYVGYSIIGGTEYPRPIDLKAKVNEQDNEVALSWSKSDTQNKCLGYNVYRNGKKLNTETVSETSYRNTNVLHGDYVYTVSSVYEGDKESLHSDSVSVNIKYGAPYYAPTNITASVDSNRYVGLKWETPDYHSLHPALLHWDNGTNADALGLDEGGYFWAGSLFDYDDLIDYRGMMLDTVNVFVKERCLALSLKIFKDDECVYTQKVSDIVYGENNAVKLTTPLKIERGCSYKVSFLVMHESGLRPIGMDGSPAVESKGNLMSLDEKEWFPASYAGASGNFNISIHLSPSADSPEEAPIAYSIYRNGERINDMPVTGNSYTDILHQSGDYNYQVSSLYNGGFESELSGTVDARIIDIGERHAPSLLQANVELNRDVHLRWNFPLATESRFPVDIATMPVTCLPNHPEYVSSFPGHVQGEMAVASDGKYIYSSMYKANGTINKYLLNGEFVESFNVNENLSGIRNMVYSGKAFYATDGNSNIYKLDMENKTVTDTIPISEVARHIAYIPGLDDGKGGFEVGDWETSIFVNMNGAKLSDGGTYKGASGTAYYNGTIYAFEQGYDNPYMICAYDSKTHEQTACIDLSDYVEISPAEGAASGGMTVINTADGLHLLALALQEPAVTRFVFLDLDGVQGVAGYNVYRNGEKVNSKPVAYRYYSDGLAETGEYRYEIQTVYIDGTVSDKSQAANVEIVGSGDCDSPVEVKARASSYPYNVIVSFENKENKLADMFESIEDVADGENFAHSGWDNVDNFWNVTAVDAYDGQHAITANMESEAWLVIPTDGYPSDFTFSMVTRNVDDSKGSGKLDVLTSSSSSSKMDFHQTATFTTTEEWADNTVSIPATTRYIAIRKQAGVVPALVDAIRIDDKTGNSIYGYDVYRDGKKINSEIVKGISYTDHNLVNGDYSYQVKAHYNTSCVSELSEPAEIEVLYSNDCQKPGQLSAEQRADGVLLKWSAPALGSAIDLKWHDGVAYDAAGMPSGGSYFAGVQWTAQELKPYSNLSLSEVQVYVNLVPDVMFLLVYQGSELVWQQYVPSLIQRSYNTITLDNPIVIDASKSMRVAIYVEHNEVTVPLGYDAGPANRGKGDLYSADGITWSTLYDNDIDGNWNITAGLRPYVPQEAKAHGSTVKNVFGGYNIYCNNEVLNESPLNVTSYIDSLPHRGYLEYQVKAIYSDYGEVGSNKVQLMATDIQNPTSDDVHFSIEKGSVVVSGAEPGTIVKLYDAAGKAAYAGIVTYDGMVKINTSVLNDGVYIISAGGVHGKIRVQK